MRDPLLDDGNTYLAAYQNAGETARREAIELPEAMDIASGLAAWCRHVLYDTDVFRDWEEGQDLSVLLALPPDQSPLQAFGELADTRRRDFFEQTFTRLLEKTTSRDTDVMAWLLGHALALALVERLGDSSRPMGNTVLNSHKLASSCDVTHFAFQATLQDLLRNDPLALFGFLSDMETHIDTIMADPCIGTYTNDRDSFNSIVEAWRSKRSVLELRTMRGDWVPVHYRFLDLLSYTIPVDRAATFDRLDRLDFPHPVRQVLAHEAILHDREEIAAILKAVPSCSDDGRSWNRRLSAILVLEIAESHCHELWRAGRQALDQGKASAEIIQETETTLSAWLEQLGAIVMARPDGGFLGAQWLLLKITDERMERARRGRAGNNRHDQLQQTDLIEWIALGLFKAGFQSGNIEALVELPERATVDNVSPLKPISSPQGSAAHCLGALSMIAFLDHMIGEVPSDGIPALLDRLDTLLAYRDSGVETEYIVGSDASGLPAHCCGYLFASTDDPAVRWRQSWNLLVEQRRRAQHWRETKDGDALAPSFFLLAVGIAGVRWLLSSQSRDGNKESALWRAVFDGARDCWLTVFLAPFSGQIETHIGRLFALHPMIFGGSNADKDKSSELDRMVRDGGYSERLSQDLAFLGGNDLIVVVCLLNAYKNGASLATISDVLKWNNGQVDAVLRQFERWQGVERPIRRRSDLAEELTGLRTEIARFETT